MNNIFRRTKYSLPSPGANILIPDEITNGLKTKVIGSDVIVYERTTSTMDVAKKIARSGFKNGTVIFAEEQTHGRGRSGRSWICPKYKGLLFTLLLSHKIQPEYICLLTGTMAVSIAETVREYLNLPVEIKWPNDILIKGKKTGGILVELEKTPGKEFVFLIGIGININLCEEELPGQDDRQATSLAIESGNVIDRISFAQVLFQEIDKWYLILKDEHFGYISRQWKKSCVTIGETLTITECGMEYNGTVVDISYNGGLMLRLDNGQIKVLRGEHARIKYA